MTDIRELLSSKVSLIPQELVPAVSLGMIIVALVLIIVFFGLCVLYINSKPKPIIKRNDKDVEKKETTPQRIRHEDLPVLSGRLGEILSLYGFLHAGPVTKIFFKVLEIMKNSTYELRWRYKLPCFMMVGPEKSGKSTLLNNLNLEHLTADGSAIDSMWKLFKKGAVFEFPKMEATEDQHKFWSFISELFVFIRPRRPLDGIVVTLPADMLISDSVNIEKHAQEMFDKIFEFQHEVNFRLPIYLIVTKTDEVPGFAEFAHLLAEPAKQQIFGWSCPYAINNSFSTAWINEIFQTVTDGIKKAAIHFSQENRISDDLTQAILFETHFNSLKQSLMQYLHAMFHSHNPEDGLLLRGVYFVGRQKEAANVPSELLQPTALTPKLQTSVDANSIASYNDTLYFVQDLFTEKIFKEYNIAYPININAIDMNQKEYRNKIILAASSIALSFGWFFGNNNIKNKISDFYQLISPMKTTMTKIKYLEDHLKGAEEQALINKYTSTLLQNMPVVKRWDLTSIFVPQSWFSSLHREIKETLGLVFDSIVVRAMYIDLNLNTKNVLQNIDSQLESPYQKKDLFDTGSFKSFKNLQEFIHRISSIKKVSAEYNSIRTLEDRKSVIDLTSTLFKDKFDITEEMKNRAPNKRLMPPKFDLALFKPKIEANLRILFSTFLKDVFDVTIEKILQNVVGDINKIVEAAKEAAVPYSAKKLAKIYSKTTLVAEILKNKNFDWIAQEMFMPNKQYGEMIEVLKASDVVSAECTKDLLRQAEVEFRKFKTHLREYKSDLTDELLSANIQTPSVGFGNFQKEVRAILDLPFICVVPDANLVTTILEDKMLLWDVKRLKKLAELIDKYYEFTETMPQNMRAQYFEMYKAIARKCFYPTIQSMLGASQIFDDMPLGHSRDLLEDAYKRLAVNVRNASVSIPKIVKILDEIQEEDNQKDIGFSSLIVSYYSALLEKIDALFNLETPYSAGSAVFDNWNGNQKPKFLDIDNKEGLKQYLTAQFERIKFLAKDLASPIVDILSMPHILEKVKNKTTLEKWKEIISSVNDYEAKKPGNSIAALEAFVTESLSKVSISGFDSQGEIKTISETGGDFFLSRRSEVAKSLLSRVDVVQYDKAATSYNNLSKFFNDSLKDKFPFGNSDEDASVSDIETFVNMFEENCKNISVTFEQNKTQKNVSEKAINFLKSMDKLIPFLKTWILQSKGSDVNTAPVSFNVQLRPSPTLEAFTSSVLDRAININDVPVANNTNGVFFNGDKVTAVFNWVASSDEKPNEKAATGNLSINASKAEFSYSGKWALFRLIEDNKINKGVEAPNGVLLQFNVPIFDTSKDNTALTSKMILKITPMLKEGDKVAPLTWPVFPKFCPDLHGNESDIDSRPKGSMQQAPTATTGNTPPIDTEVSFDEPAAQAEVEPLPQAEELDDGSTEV